MPLTLHAIVAGPRRRPRRQSISEVVLYAPLVLARILLREWAAASWGHPWLHHVAGRPNETFDNHQEHAQITREKEWERNQTKSGRKVQCPKGWVSWGVLPAVSETVSATSPPIPIKPHENLADLLCTACVPYHDTVRLLSKLSARALDRLLARTHARTHAFLSPQSPVIISRQSSGPVRIHSICCETSFTSLPNSYSAARHHTSSHTMCITTCSGTTTR